MRLLVLFFALVCSIPASWGSSAQPIIKKDIPSVYTVKKGDTLWDISAHFLSNPWLWPKLWQANSYIKNPHLIYPGDLLHLVWVDGQPQLRLKRTVKLSPSIRIKRSPITTLQESLIFPYLAEHKLLAPANLDRLPRVLGESDEKGYMAPRDTVWVDTVLESGEEWWVFRPDIPFSRTEKLGDGVKQAEVLALKEIAKVKVAVAEGGTSRMTVQSLRQEIRQNDVLLPAPLPGVEMDLSFAPSEPPVEIQATVLGHLEGQAYIATSEVVVLDRGHLDRVSAGHVFQLYRPGAKILGDKGDYQYQQNSYRSEQYQLSDVPIGEVMVIRAYEYFSLAVVTNATEPFRPGVFALPPHISSLATVSR
ncbi:LysM peptidoglycan-binding domain-containing protein [Photobacterium sp. SDRW27]|uniref:LysM peptidoglycan-binding domain-containing protein n=1 Tax=Photobacterium obscurum TaxID=2829490 RepID=UPI002243B81A|nr:LysM peptidoglycan-binding domain-containing protein [Photobacterium obscurum]MCW8331454.1 LysM peptidoglycan-binding domain-containing protein [Photobacterium obscurum]